MTHRVTPLCFAGPLLGYVIAFEPARGLGEVESGGGAVPAGARFAFHATVVADGSRHVDVGAKVVFTLAPGHRGGVEVASLVPLPSAPEDSTPSSRT